MNQQEWDEMSASDRLSHIQKTPWNVKSKTGLNGNAKVGDMENAFVTAYQVFAGEVILTNPHDSQEEAIKAALESLEGFKEAAEHEFEQSSEAH